VKVLINNLGRIYTDDELPQVALLQSLDYNILEQQDVVVLK
jgi:hypothetical protein